MDPSALPIIPHIWKNIHSLIHLYGPCFSIRGPHKDHLNGSQRKNKHEGSHEPLGNNCLSPSTSTCISHHPFFKTVSSLLLPTWLKIPCALGPRLILPLEALGHWPDCADSYTLALYPGGPWFLRTVSLNLTETLFRYFAGDSKDAHILEWIFLSPLILTIVRKL